MKIVIAGASGFVGRELIPLLSAHELVLMGRTKGNVECAGKTYVVNSYDTLECLAQGADIFLNLAVLNNNSQAREQSFNAVNSNFALDLCRLSQKIGIRRFINVSSVLALDKSNLTFYASSKRIAASMILEIAGNNETVYLGHVHGQFYSGRLAILSLLPKYLAIPVFYIFSAFKPTTLVQEIVQHIDNFKLSNAILIDSGEFAIVDRKIRNWCFRAVKRTIDLAFVSVVIGLFWWLLILIWAVVRIQSDGPPIFRQIRVGQHEVPFTCYKFRTMKVGTAELGTHEIAATAVTPFGRFLRRTKLDELPQIFNIIRNEMTLIGPRPCLQSQTELIDLRRAHDVFSILPGISGLSQTNRVDMSNPKLLAKWDAKYLATQSLVLDLKIIIRTALGYR